MRLHAPHLAAGLLAIAILFGALVGGVIYARRVEEHAVHALAPLRLPQKRLGSALQQTAIRQPDVLPIYGSSELEYGGKERGAAVFDGEPTGFQVFEVSSPGESAFHHLLELSAVGDELRGKKVVISLTPPVLLSDHAWRSYYDANFSPLHAYELVFASDLDPAIKRDAARRMLEFQGSLANDPLLRFAVVHLAHDSLHDRALYLLAWPLGMLRTLVWHLQDHWSTLEYLRSHPVRPPGRTPGGQRIDWAQLLADARRAQSANQGNPFGFSQRGWASARRKLADLRGSQTDATFLRALQRSGEWQNLDLLLAALKQWGARPLLISTPINGTYYDFLGVSARARAAYYARLETVARRYDAQLATFADHDMDTSFVNDRGSHPSRLGWVYVDVALDAFSHDNGAAIGNPPGLLRRDALIPYHPSISGQWAGRRRHSAGRRAASRRAPRDRGGCRACPRPKA